MSKRLLALNLLLAATSAFFSVQLVWILSAPRPLPPPPAPSVSPFAPSQKDEPAPVQPALAAYSAVATKNLFNPNRSEAVAATSSVASVAKPILHGVVIDGATRLAYLEDPITKRVFGYKTGDTVGGGHLEEIEEDRVVIKRPDGPLEVKLRDPSKPKPPVGASRPSPGVLPRATPPAGASPAPSTTPSTLGVAPAPPSGGQRPLGPVRALQPAAGTPGGAPANP